MIVIHGSWLFVPLTIIAWACWVWLLASQRNKRSGNAGLLGAAFIIVVIMAVPTLGAALMITNGMP